MANKKYKQLDLTKLSDLMIKFSDKQKNIAAAMAKGKNPGSIKIDRQLMEDFIEVTSKLAFDQSAILKIQKNLIKDYIKATGKFTEKVFGIDKKTTS